MVAWTVEWNWWRDWKWLCNHDGCHAVTVIVMCMVQYSMCHHTCMCSWVGGYSENRNITISECPPYHCASQWCLPHIRASLDTQSHVILIVYISIESLERLTIKGTGYTRERWNASQKIDSQRATEFVMNYSSCRLYIAAKNAVKVHAFVLDANMRHWHLRACNYSTHICIIGN